MSVSYKDAGVDIERGDALIDRIGPLAKRTHRQGVLAGVGGFGALFGLKELGRFDDPVLVTGCDGVGTKLKIAFLANAHQTVGIDLVAMSVNDILCHGAEPLFFLDYFATSQLDVAQATAVIEGIVAGCNDAGCALVGGETAELPGFYGSGEYDLAGFAVGIAERRALLPQKNVAVGDLVLGLASSGLHSNGYSLARKLVFETLGLAISDALPDGAGPVRDVLLAPTRIYVKPVLSLLREAPLAVKAIAHITGGGLIENVPRVLPAHTRALLRADAWSVPKLFRILQSAAKAPPLEMYRTFNMGIGLVLVVAAADAEACQKHLEARGETVYRLGEITDGAREPTCTISGVND